MRHDLQVSFGCGRSLRPARLAFDSSWSLSRMVPHAGGIRSKLASRGASECARFAVASQMSSKHGRISDESDLESPIRHVPQNHTTTISQGKHQ